jgi:hypothetical protein
LTILAPKVFSDEVEFILKRIETQINALVEVTDTSVKTSTSESAIHLGNARPGALGLSSLKKQTEAVHETIRYIRSRSCDQMAEYRKTLGNKLARVEELSQRTQNLKHEIVTLGGSVIRNQSLSPLSVPSSVVDGSPASSVSMIVSSFVHQNVAAPPDPVEPLPFKNTIPPEIDIFESDLEQLIAIRDTILRQIGEPLPNNELTLSS